MEAEQALELEKTKAAQDAMQAEALKVERATSLAQDAAKSQAAAAQ
jgi:hypothetical protein